jgi:hypothetical protein
MSSCQMLADCCGCNMPCTVPNAWPALVHHCVGRNAHTGGGVWGMCCCLAATNAFVAFFGRRLSALLCSIPCSRKLWQAASALSRDRRLHRPMCADVMVESVMWACILFERAGPVLLFVVCEAADRAVTATSCGSAASVAILQQQASCQIALESLHRGNSCCWHWASGMSVWTTY